MDSRLIEQIAKLVQDSQDKDETQESGFLEMNQDVSLSLSRSRGYDSCNVSTDHGCFVDTLNQTSSSLDSYGILGTAVAGGGRNISRASDFPQQAAVNSYREFITMCWRELLQLQTYRRKIDTSPPASFPAELNLENYISASVAEQAKLKSLPLNDIQKILSNWFALLTAVNDDIKQQRECRKTLLVLRETVLLITTGLFKSIYQREPPRNDSNRSYYLSKSQMTWNYLLNQRETR